MNHSNFRSYGQLPIAGLFSFPLVCMGLLGMTVHSGASAQGFQVGEQTVVYTDASRGRTIKTEVWYPTTEVDEKQNRKTDLPFVLPPTIRNASFIPDSFPLVILSHGTGGNRFSLAWLAIDLARSGFVVISPDHWGNTYDNKIPEYFVRYWDRPLDISFLLTSFLLDTTFGPLIDRDKIGLAGFSFGGYTALAAGGIQISCELLKRSTSTKEGKAEFRIPELGDLTTLIQAIPCPEIPVSFKDERIKAIVAMAPALGMGLPDERQEIACPVLIISAGSDRIAPAQTNAMRYHEKLPASMLISLEDETGHYVFLNEGNKELKTRAKPYYKDHRSVNRSEVHKHLNHEIIRFFMRNLQ